MQKHLPLFLLLSTLLITISSCKKDVAGLVSGTYVVSGGNPNDSSIAIIHNATIEIREKGKEQIIVSCINLPYGTELTLDYDEMIGAHEVYFFSDVNYTGYQLDVAFFKSDLDSIDVHYVFWDSMPRSDYALAGRRQ